MTTTSTEWLGARPSDELIKPNSDPMRTAQAYRTAIRMVVGDEPIGAYLRVLRSPLSHDDPFEVAIEFDPAIPTAREYAQRCREYAPTTWAAAGMSDPNDRQQRSRS